MKLNKHPNEFYYYFIQTKRPELYMCVCNFHIKFKYNLQGRREEVFPQTQNTF